LVPRRDVGCLLVLCLDRGVLPPRQGTGRLRNTKGLAARTPRYVPVTYHSFRAYILWRLTISGSARSYGSLAGRRGIGTCRHIFQEEKRPSSGIYGYVSHVEAPSGTSRFGFCRRKKNLREGDAPYSTNVIYIEPSYSLRSRFPIKQFEICDSQYPISEKSVPYIYSVNAFQNLTRQLREALVPHSLWNY
jgi:hypothetical protein